MIINASVSQWVRQSASQLVNQIVSPSICQVTYLAIDSAKYWRKRSSVWKKKEKNNSSRNGVSRVRRTTNVFDDSLFLDFQPISAFAKLSLFQGWVVRYCANENEQFRWIERELFCLTVVASLASMGTTPWSVITARFSSSLAMLAMAAQTLANTWNITVKIKINDRVFSEHSEYNIYLEYEKRTSLSLDLRRLTISSRPPTNDRTISPASWEHVI